MPGVKRYDPVVMHGDCEMFLGHLDRDSVDLVFADPPFNIGCRYDGYSDSLSGENYLDWCNRWLTLCRRALKPGGSIFVASGLEYSAEIHVIMKGLFRLRNWITWEYTFGVHSTTKFGRDHIHLHYFVKDGAPWKWRPDAIRIPSMRTTVYNDKRAHPKGRVPGDVWHYPRICGTHAERRNFPCQLPELMLERVILATTDPGDMVVDPFAGSGTTLAVADRLGRRSIGMDQSLAYVEDIHVRLREARDG
jgi:DNA modification methylase